MSKMTALEAFKIKIVLEDVSSYPLPPLPNPLPGSEDGSVFYFYLFDKLAVFFIDERKVELLGAA